MIKRLLVAVSILLVGCATGRPKPPTPPTPIPPPSMKLHVEGNRFVTSDGKDPRLLGPIVGCHLDGISGWPLVCVESLDAIKAYGLNWTTVRTGPFTAEGEAPQFAFYERAPNGKYDLTKINPAFLALVRSIAVAAKARDIYLQVDLPGDRWVRQHGAHGRDGLDPWSAEMNLQGEEHGTLGIFQSAPDPVHEAAVRAIVATLCDLDNVYFSSGNEAFKSASVAFESRIVALVHECAGKIVGANSVEGATVADFEIVHESAAQSPKAKPVLVDEYGPDISPDEVIVQALNADAARTYFMYWKGSHGLGEWNATMEKLGKIRAGTPPPMPQICVISQADVPQVTPRPDDSDSRIALIDAATAHVMASQPEMFNADGNIEGWPSDGTLQANAAKPFFNAQVSYLHDLGYCAAVWEDSIAWGKTEWGWYEEWHTLNFGPGKPIDGRHSYRFTWKFE